MNQKSRLSSSAQELINRCSAADFERMRSSFTSEEIQALVNQGLLENEAIWLLFSRASRPTVSPDDPIWNDRTFRLSYRMPSGRMEPLVLRYRPTPSSDSEAPPDSTA